MYETNKQKKEALCDFFWAQAKKKKKRTQMRKMWLNL